MSDLIQNVDDFLKLAGPNCLAAEKLTAEFNKIHPPCCANDIDDDWHSNIDLIADVITVVDGMRAVGKEVTPGNVENELGCLDDF